VSAETTIATMQMTAYSIDDCVFDHEFSDLAESEQETSRTNRHQDRYHDVEYLAGQVRL
jgi:hypothetical protein